MAQIANRTGNVENAQNCTDVAHSYVSKWMDLAIAEMSDNFTNPHTTLYYGDNDTYSLLYNLFGDRELGLDLVPQSVYDMQSAFYPTSSTNTGFRSIRETLTPRVRIQDTELQRDTDRSLIRRLATILCVGGKL